MREDTTDLNVPTDPPIPATMIRSTKDPASGQDVSYNFIFSTQDFCCQVLAVKIFFLFGHCFKLLCYRKPASSEEATWDG